MAEAKPGTLKTITSADYIRANFQPSDRIAVLLRNAERQMTAQRISTAEKIAAHPFQEWMRYKNAKEGFDIYVGMNTLKPTAFRRTKDDILAIRHLYVDLDQGGSASLAAIEKSNLVPTPSYVLNTSADKYQVIWKVEGIAHDQAESLLHALARQFDGDHAATDSTRVLRVPGFMNKKYEHDFLVRVQSRSQETYHLRDFDLRAEALDLDYRQPRNNSRKTATSEPRPTSQSERDWAHVKSALAKGADPHELIQELAQSRSSDKSDPQYYARLTVSKALAELRMPSRVSGGYSHQLGDDTRESKH